MTWVTRLMDSVNVLFHYSQQEEIDMADVRTIMDKLRDLNQQMTTLTTTIADLEGTLTTAMAEAFVAGSSEQSPELIRITAELARAKAQFAEQATIKPRLLDMLHAARVTRREARITDYAQRIERAAARQEACNREIVRLRAAFEVACKPLEQERSDMQDEVLRLAQPSVQLRRPQDAWRGSLEALEALIHDEEAEIRPDEIERVLTEWRAQERREGSRINEVELAFERATGRITTAGIASSHSRAQLRELRGIAQEREERARQAAQARA